jgi:UDP-3-O-[3-hydroxymyristoyl] glucosamine N-acyltransferase
MKLGELVQILNGKLAQGNPEFVVNGVNSSALASATELVFAEDAASAAKALASSAGVVLLRAGLAEAYPEGKCVVEAEQPRLWFAWAGKLLKPVPPAAGVHPSAVVGTNVKLGAGVSIGPCAVVGEGASIGKGTRIEAGAVIGEGVRIGDDCRIYPRAVLYSGTTLGNRVVVHAGVVLGADGFGYVRDPATGAYTQFPQQGTLLIEDDVEIGANSTIDRGALKQTKIGRGTKFDNLVHVGGHQRLLHGGQRRGDRRAGGHRRPCAHRPRRDSWRPGRRAERQDRHQRGHGRQAGKRAVGHAGATAPSGSTRTGGRGPAREKARGRE